MVLGVVHSSTGVWPASSAAHTPLRPPSLRWVSRRGKGPAVGRAYRAPHSGPRSGEPFGAKGGAMDAPARGRAARLFLHRRTAEAPCVLPLTSPPRTRACVHAGGPRRALSLCPGNVSWRSWAREKEGSEDEGGGQRGRGKTGAGLGH